MKRFLTLTKRQLIGPTGGNQEGLWTLNLDCWQRQGEKFAHIGRLIVNSGQPFAQRFRTLDHQVAGEYEPLPEAVYTPGPLEWASGKWGDSRALFPAVQSPIWATIYGPRAIGFHLDGNRGTSPGSAACVVFRTNADMHTYVEWHEGDPYKFSSLWVNWDLGSIQFPHGLQIPK